MVLHFYLKETEIQHVQSSFSNDDSEQMENHFENLEEDFVPNMSNNNNLSWFSYRCHVLGESNLSLSPIFWISDFSCFDTCFQNANLRQMETNSRELREFFAHKKLIYKKISQILHSCHDLGDTKSNLQPQFLAVQSIFHGRQFQNLM